MSGAPIDLSAGLVQSPPPTGGIDLSAGLVGTPPAPPDDEIPSPHESALDGITGFANDIYSGVTHGLAQTAAGIGKIANKLDPSIPQSQTLQNAAAQPDENIVQSGGNFMESAMEFFLGDEALKGLSLADKLKKVVPSLKAVENSPRLAAALESAMRTGAVSGGQTAAKTGGDIPQTMEATAAGAATGGLLTAGAGAASDAIAHASPVEGEVAGQKILTPRPAAVPPETQAQQTAAKNVISQTAKDAAGENVGLVNDRPTMEMRPGVQGEPTGHMTTPKAPIVDVPSAVAQVNSFGDAADEVEKAAKRSYDIIDATTNGKFSEVRDDFNQARKDVYNAGSVGERDAAQVRLENATARMRQIFDDTDGQVSAKDWQNANTAWNNSKTLKQVHDAVESTFDTDAGFSQRSGTYRGFNGNMLRQRLNRLTQTIGEPELNRVIGRDNMDNLRKVAELTRTNADRAKFGAAVQQVGGWLALHHTGAAGIGGLVGHMTGVGYLPGAIGGEAAYMAARKVMQAVATNPRVGQQLTFAVESGARPEYFAPLIGKMIRDAQEQQPEEAQ
jgi:hypothetical protein